MTPYDCIPPVPVPPPPCPPNRLKSCFFYFITSVFISITIFLVVILYLDSTEKLQNLQFATEEISKSMVKPEPVVPQDRSSDKIVNNLPVVNTCSKESIEDAIKKHIEELRNEITAANIKLDQMNLQSTSIPVSRPLKNENPETTLKRVDYASDALGAKIVYVEGEPFHKQNFLISILSWIIPGIKCYSNGPRELIHDTVLPGRCYGFRGGKSSVVIQLPYEIFIDSVSVQHIKELESPNGNLTSAPKDFEVYGVPSMKMTDKFYLGSFTYDIQANPVQLFTFAAPPKNKFRLIEFQFNSNHGHQIWTCIYKVFVYGTL